MLAKSIIFLGVAVAVAVTDAFVVIPANQNVIVVQAVKKSDDDVVDNTDVTLASLQHQYKVLQEHLLDEIVLHRNDHDGSAANSARFVEEQMIETVTKATRLHEHRQEEIIEEAYKEIKQAEEARKKAIHLKEKIFEDTFATSDGDDSTGAAGEKNDEKMIESLNKAYEDLERLNDFELSFDFKELEAKHKLEAAKLLLEDLKTNEAKLMKTLNKLHEEDWDYELEQTTHENHRSFLDKIKDAIYAHPDLLASLDPHIL